MTRTFIIDKSSLPNLPAMMLATLNALREMSGSASLHELDEKVAEIEGVSEEEQSYIMPNGNTIRLKYFLSWARTYLRRGGALENSARGIWGLTEKGEKIVSLNAVQEIHDQVLVEERERARVKRLANKVENNDHKNDMLDDNLDDVSSTDWQQLLLSAVRDMTPDGFERLSQRLLREAGFIKVEVRGKTGDGGIDGVGILRVNLVSFQVYFQCKKYKGSVGSKEIRDFRGALQGRADKGLFITTGNFTSHASEEATRDGAIAIDLIDGERLCELLKQFGLGVETEMIEQVNINTDWFKGI